MAKTVITWISEAEAMEMLGFTTERALRFAAKEGSLAGKIGYCKPHYRCYRYSKESIERYLNSNASIAV